MCFQPENNPERLEPWLVREMDSCISNIFLNEDQDAFIQLFNLILYENMNGMTLAIGLIVFITLITCYSIDIISLKISFIVC